MEIARWKRSVIARIEPVGLTLWEAIKDKWLTWRTGVSKDEREYRAWRDQNIVPRAGNVTNYFQGFKYIIAIDYYKVCTVFDPLFGFLESGEFLSYMYPRRPLGQNCYYGCFRGEWDKWDHQFYINDIGGIDQMFIATNSEEDAVFFKLKWT